MPSPTDDLVALASIKSAIKALQAEQEVVEARVVAALKDKGRKTLSVQLDEDGARIRGTLVEGSRIIIDPDRLKAALNAEQWKKVTSTVLDKEKLEAAIVQDIVDENVVASVSEEKANRPYINVTGKVPARDLGKIMLEAGSARVVTRRVRAGKKVRPARKVI